MSQPLPFPPPGFDALTVDQKIEYVQSLWEQITADPERVPTPEWHRQVVEGRLQSYRLDPDSGIPWSEAREDLRNRQRESRG